MDKFKESKKATSTPLLKDLHNHVTPHYAARWGVIGTLLGLSKGRLDIIQYDNRDKAEACCDAVLEEWLEVDRSASWEKLFEVIESPAVSSGQAPDKVTSKPDMDKSIVTDQGVSILSDRVKQLNIQTRFAVDEDAWPPNQPQNFIPLLLIHRKSQHNFKQAAALQLARAGTIRSHSHSMMQHQQNCYQIPRNTMDKCKTTKQLVDILNSLQDGSDGQFILVEGLPGIGKSLLLQEIAYNWANGKLLQNFKLVILVQLRSPAVQQVSLVADLFQLTCEGDKKALEIAVTSSDYFFENKGKGLVFLIDGFDEFPEHLQKDSLITSILKRKVLPHCGLVVSSRPHASVRLRQQAIIRVDILGFAEEERKLYIEQSLKGQPHAIKEITKYLGHNLTINGLCFIPFNMVILTYLYKQGIPLPSNCTLLYKYFICLTICRHLAKFGHSLKNVIPDLANLPEPCITIIKQLSKLALQGLNYGKIVFTLQEMRAACPDITTIPGAINGFGLLKVVEHFGLTGKMMTFNFVHFSIHEFLAAYHITQLPPCEELQVLKAQFWSNLHSNMFAMYISLTNGQRTAFKLFLSDDDDTVPIADAFLDDQLKCLRLFRCFYEANDRDMYTAIQNAKIFDGSVINLRNNRLTPYDVECITLFLTCTPDKTWKELNLRYCHIQDQGLRVLYRDFQHSDVTIKVLNLSFNGLTRLSSSLISDLIIHCKVEVLWMEGRYTVTEDLAIYNMLSHPFSALVRLDLRWSSLSSSSAFFLFRALAQGNKLQWLNISHNNIDNTVCDVIATSLNDNNSLVELWVHGNDINHEGAQSLLLSLYHNNMLQQLSLPKYSKDNRERIESLQEEVNMIRNTRGCQTKLNISFWTEYSWH